MSNLEKYWKCAPNVAVSRTAEPLRYALIELANHTQPTILENESAILWDLLTSGHSERDIVNELVQFYDLDQSLAHTHLNDYITQLNNEGYLISRSN